MDFTNRLRPWHLSSSFWYLPSPANVALVAAFGALLRASSPGEEEKAFYKARLKEYRWTLGVSCGRAEWLRESVGLVDALIATIGADGGYPTPPALHQQQQRQTQRKKIGGKMRRSSHASERERLTTTAAKPTSIAAATSHDNAQTQWQQTQHTSATLASLRAKLGLDVQHDDPSHRSLDGEDDDEDFDDDEDMDMDDEVDTEVSFKEIVEESAVAMDISCAKGMAATTRAVEVEACA